MKKLTEYLKTHKYARFSDIKRLYLTQEVKDNLNKYSLALEELCYRIQNNISLSELITCKHCGKKLAFDFKNGHGYGMFCDKKCSQKYNTNQQSIKDKREQTTLLKYGSRNVSQVSSIKDKKKQTYINKYGVDHYSKTQEYKDKVKQTCIDKYDKDNPLKVKTIQDKRKQTCLNKYGETTNLKTQECKDKIKKTCINKYGKDNYSKTQEFKNFMQEHQAEIQAKIKHTILKKYGIDSYSKTQECKDKTKQTCLDRYGTDSYSKTDDFKDYFKKHYDEIQKKINITKAKNGTYNTSKPEEECYKLLIDKFGKEDIIRQYRSEEYPFSCDFYIKSLKLYIECNGNWTHGYHNNKCLGSFDKNNKEHLEILNKWKEKAVDSKFYKNAIYVWTDLDVRKLETLKKNKLNYKIFWNTEEAKAWVGELKI